MSDSYIYTGLEEFERKKAPARLYTKSFLLKIVVGILFFALLCELIIYTCLIPMRAPVKIAFKGNAVYTPAELYQMLSVAPNTTWMQFNAAHAASVLSASSGIESVSVEKHFPDSVVITVQERTPVAVTLLVLNGRTVPVSIDKNGILFASQNTNYDPSLPLITGLPLENIQLGMRIGSVYRPLMEQIAALQQLPEKYLSAISEIHIEPKRYGGYDLILYPMSSRVKVFTDKALNQEALQYMMVVLDVVDVIGQDITEIDLRYGAVSYRTR